MQERDKQRTSDSGDDDCRRNLRRCGFGHGQQGGIDRRHGKRRGRRVPRRGTDGRSDFRVANAENPVYDVSAYACDQETARSKQNTGRPRLYQIEYVQSGAKRKGKERDKQNT